MEYAKNCSTSEFIDFNSNQGNVPEMGMNAFSVISIIYIFPLNVTFETNSWVIGVNPILYVTRKDTEGGLTSLFLI